MKVDIMYIIIVYDDADGSVRVKVTICATKKVSNVRHFVLCMYVLSFPSIPSRAVVIIIIQK